MNNKELELEAEKYAIRFQRNDNIDDLIIGTSVNSFINGATSKYVEKQKLEFAIELLNELEFNPKENIVEFVLHIKNKIKELEQQLNKL